MSTTPPKERDLHPGKLVWILMNAGLADERREQIAIPSIIAASKEIVPEAEFYVRRGILRKVSGGYAIADPKGIGAYRAVCGALVDILQNYMNDVKLKDGCVVEPEPPQSAPVDSSTEGGLLHLPSNVSG